MFALIVSGGVFFFFGWVGFRLAIARGLYWVSKRNEKIYDAEMIKFLLCAVALIIDFRWVGLNFGVLPWWVCVLAWSVLAGLGWTLSRSRYVDSLDRPQEWIK